MNDVQDYPASIEIRTPATTDRWRPLVQWLLATPHLIIVCALEYVAGAVAIVSWFVIVFTGRLPEGLANFQAMILRYSARVQAYAGFLHAEYPPFEFPMVADDPGGTPVTLTVRPDLADRNRLTVGFRFVLAIPAMIWTFLIGIVGAVCWILALFAVLFTGRWPDGLRRWVMVSLRVSTRTSAYVGLLTDEYPPFSTD